MTFNKSHLGVFMVTRGHFVTIKIFPGGQLGVRTRARALSFCPLWRRPCI